LPHHVQGGLELASLLQAERLGLGGTALQGVEAGALDPQPLIQFPTVVVGETGEQLALEGRQLGVLARLEELAEEEGVDEEALAQPDRIVSREAVLSQGEPQPAQELAEVAARGAVGCIRVGPSMAR
jgi:hypothetical protein